MIIIFSSNDSLEVVFDCLSQNFKISGLVTEPPKPQGRGLKVCPNIAHSFAKSKGLPVLAPPKFDEAATEKIRDFISDNNITLGLSSAYGKIIPQRIIDLFKSGIINIHPSLLPKYRGPSPIVTSILNRDKESGYSIIKIDAGCDTGDLIAQSKVQVGANDSQADLKKRILTKVCNDLPEIINGYLSGQISPSKQKHDQATYTQKIKKSDAEILDTDTASQALGKILAYSEWPKAFLVIGNERIIIHRAHKAKDNLVIDVIQLEGKRAMSFSDFKNGYPKLLTELPDFVNI